MITTLQLHVNLGVFLSAHSFSMVTFNAKKVAVSCSPMFGYLFDVIYEASSEKEWQYKKC